MIWPGEGSATECRTGRAGQCSRWLPHLLISVCLFCLCIMFVVTDGFLHSQMRPRLRGSKRPYRAGRTELEPFNSGTGRNRTRNRTEPNRTSPSHDVSEKHRPNRVEPVHLLFKIEPNRTDEFSKSPEPKRIEPNRVPSC